MLKLEESSLANCIPTGYPVPNDHPWKKKSYPWAGYIKKGICINIYIYMYMYAYISNKWKERTWNSKRPGRDLWEGLEGGERNEEITL